MICFVSLTGFTGGPLALHQAAEAVREAGAEAGVLYIRPRRGQWHFADDGKALRADLGFRGRRKIDKRLAGFGFDSNKAFPKDATFVVPEAMPDLAFRLLMAGCRNVVFWWLSVDNFPLGSLATLETQRVLRDCRHVSQSAYASDFAQRQGIARVGMLSDVTDLGPLPALRPMADRSIDLVYLPNKARGAEDLIDRLKQEFRVVALAGMGRDELRDTLLDARLFVDFGHHPGKDRVPREAALCGAIPVVRRVGAACFPEDVPLPEALLPETPLFLDGDALAGHLRAILNEADHWQAALEEYRALIRQEKAVFEQEIRALIKG